MRKIAALLLSLCLVLTGCGGSVDLVEIADEGRLDLAEGIDWSTVQIEEEFAEFGGRPYSVVLLSSGVIDQESGEFEGDDRNFWYLTVTDGFVYYNVYDDQIQLGSASFKTKGNRITLSIKSEAGNEKRVYVFDETEGKMYEEVQTD